MPETTTSGDEHRRRPIGWARALIALAAVVAAIVAGVLLAGQGTPSSNARLVSARGLESMFEDDQLLVNQPLTPAGTATVQGTVNTLHELGVDRLRVVLEWYYLAPDNNSPTRPPGFRAGDPAAYPAAGWALYDRVVRLATRAGIGVDLDVSGPGPLWAMTPGAPDAKTSLHYLPSISEFRQFVAAVGRRYDGRYRPGGPGAAAAAPLPRVSFWSIWNEPNQPGWLAPQWVTANGQTVPLAARAYRGLVDAAFAGLAATGHTPAHDTILFGDLAPEGCVAGSPCVYPRTEWPIPPIPFLQALYCLDSAYRPLHGQAARLLGCPPGAGTGAFVAANPGLFRATGLAHHPYAFYLAPSVSMPNPQFVPLADLSRIETGLDRSFAAYRVNRHLPLYLTEYGYETSPPRAVPPFTTLRKQALYLNQATYMAWHDPRVLGLAQFLLQDTAPNSAYPAGTRKYWSTFQTGIEFLGGTHKPSFDSYQLPIFLPSTTAGADGHIEVWGMLRPAPNGTKQVADIQWRTSHGSYRTIGTVTTANASGVVDTSVKLPGSGAVRLAWKSPSGQLMHSLSMPASTAG